MENFQHQNNNTTNLNPDFAIKDLRIKQTHQYELIELEKPSKFDKFPPNSDIECNQSEESKIPARVKGESREKTLEAFSLPWPASLPLSLFLSNSPALDPFIDYL